MTLQTAVHRGVSAGGWSVNVDRKCLTAADGQRPDVTSVQWPVNNISTSDQSVLVEQPSLYAWHSVGRSVGQSVRRRVSEAQVPLRRRSNVTRWRRRGKMDSDG